MFIIVVDALSIYIRFALFLEVGVDAWGRDGARFNYKMAFVSN